MAIAGLKFRVSTFGPRLYFVSRANGGAVGVSTTHIDDIAGCGLRALSHSVRKYVERRVGDLKVRKEKFAHVRLELNQAADFWAQLTSEQFADAPNPIPTAP